MAPEAHGSFSRRVVAWQRACGRHGLPWQGGHDPYPIWLSEIMLQQTQVQTVLPYFARFMATFPTVADLAAAPQEQVLSLWAGLGYYARARNLHACAQAVVAEHGGRFPGSAEQLAQLPGIGRSTAAAIAAFAYGERSAILDGNVKRVLCRHFAVEGVPTGKVEKALWQLAESLVPESGDMGAYTQGLMDLGATLCQRRRPVCGECPLAETCLARAQGRQDELPTPKAPKQQARRKQVFLVLTDGQHVLLERRPQVGIWGGLLSLPEGLDLLPRLGLLDLPLEPMSPREHVFTHFRLEMQPLLARVEQVPLLAAEGGLLWLPLAEALEAGVPAPVGRLLVELIG